MPKTSQSSRAEAAVPSGSDTALSSAGHAWSSCFQTGPMYPSGAVLFEQGSLVHDIYWLVEGLVKLVHVDESGGERILELQLPPRFIGASLGIVDLPSPVSAVTVTRCRVQRISRAEFVERLATDRQFSWDVHHVQSQEVYGQFRRLAALSTASSRIRLERFLRDLIESTARPSARICLPLKRWELAQLLAVTPEHLSRLFKQLCHEGVISFEKGWLIVPAADRLAGGARPDPPGIDCDGLTKLNRLSA